MTASGLLRRLDVDPDQWRALVVAGLKLDFRSPTAGQSTASGLKRLIAAQSMYLVLGLALGSMALFAPDVFASGTVTLTVTMFLAAASVLIEFAVVVISPLDYDVLGFQPVSSRTYFAARFANVLFYTAVTTTMAAFLPMAAYFFAHGFNPVLGLAGVVAFYLACTTTTLAMIAAYVAMAHVVHPRRLRRVLTYLQLILSFAVYGGYLLLPELFDTQRLGALKVDKAAWMLLYPPTWFASYLDIAAGHHSALEILPALASLAALGLLVRAAAGRLSLDYSELLSRQFSRSEGVQRRAGRGWLQPLGRGERRAVGLLLRAQFRYDQRFRLGVLSIIPLTVFYLFLGLREGTLADPFLASATPGGHSSSGSLLYFAILFVPMMLIMSVSRSDAFRAAWVFYVTPASRGKLVLAAKNLVVSWLLVPYLVCLAIVLAWFIGNPVHAALHILVEALLANVFLITMVALQPEVPFSKPIQKGQTTAGFFVLVLIGSIIQSISVHVLSLIVYPYPIVVALVIAGLALAGLSAERSLRRRLDYKGGEMEFLS
jgi:ABC-2 type transport system permease protein